MGLFFYAHSDVDFLVGCLAIGALFYAHPSGCFFMPKGGTFYENKSM